MTRSKRETERTYETPAAYDASWLAGLLDVEGIASVAERGTEKLDAVYYDTDDLRLVGASVTLRRRTGGADAGWRLKLPMSGADQEEVSAPLSKAIPNTLRDLVVSRVRETELRPVVRIRSTRRVRHLLDSAGTVLAELSLDEVRADFLSATTSRASWTEMEVTLAEDIDSSLLDGVDERLRDKGIGCAGYPSKLARALEETGAEVPLLPDTGRETVVPGSAADEVLSYVDQQARTLVDIDPAVRRGLPDAVHKMRVTCRRLRSTLRTYRPVLDRKVTDPIREELKWLGGELAAARDQEVLAERLGSHIRALPRELLLGRVDARLQEWNVTRTAEARQRTLDALRSPRYLELLDSLTALAEQPPLARKAETGPEKVMVKAILKEYERLVGRVAHALELSPGTERDEALHQARKAAKRTRYATEPARASLGKPAKRLGRRVKAVQKVLGDHQDSVGARQALRNLALEAHAAHEPSFTWGLLYGQEQAEADTCERNVPTVWAPASKPRLRKALAG
ncbi:CYTH and CHAD domain-containing protein [Streptomyces sp. NPDC051920]|uniref:CYTH and CHAD domain-containing protein n=1 Tax=Streptomyces sp. NPDC051920 TaxID=3155523 RepID=UPI003421379F